MGFYLDMIVRCLAIPGERRQSLSPRFFCIITKHKNNNNQLKSNKYEKSEKIEIKREEYIFPKLNKIKDFKYNEIKKLEQKCKEYKNEPSTDEEMNDDNELLKKFKGQLLGKKIAICGITKIPREYFYKIIRNLGGQISPWINTVIH